jgi:anion-transporting  ArsA/GET3 family ATPase
MPKRHVRLADRLADTRVCICAGSGGVGKTTTAAALALALAEQGQKVAVVTIDPAKRLATSLGLAELGNEPSLIDAKLLASHGVEMRGELWAMMLDSKRTFDGLVSQLAANDHAREEVLSNRIYQELSSAVAGSQEFTAMAKLFELHQSGDFDVIVLDTPPSRNALDFLDAPTRLAGFLDGRALSMFLAPGGLAARVVGRGTGLVFSVFARFTGVDLLSDLSTFFGSLGGMTDGFRERAHAVEELLRDPSTNFLIVTSPEPEPTREAIFFAGKLADAGMQRAGVIVNRVHIEDLGGHTSDELASLLSKDLGEKLAGRVATNLADFDVLAQRDRDSVAALSKSLDDPDPILIPDLDAEVRDLTGLAEVARHLLA